MHARPLPHTAAVLLIGLAAALLVACASSGATTGSAASPSGKQLAPNAPLPGKPGCFWLRNFQDWTVLNETTLIVRAPLRHAYVVRLFEPVFDLNVRLHLGFEDVEHTGQICNDSWDDLIVPGYMPSRIPIIAVHALTMPEETALLKAAGKPVPRHAGSQS